MVTQVMEGQRNKMFAVAGFGLLGVLLLGISTWPRSLPPEPIYRGRALSDWLDFCQHPSRDWEHREDAAIAVRSIGTNALPFLLEWMRDDPPWKFKLRVLLGNLPDSIKRAAHLSTFTDKPDFGSLAVGGFSILGNEAAPAVPELTRILYRTHSWQRQRWTIQALGSIGEEALPALVDAAAIPGNQHRELIFQRIGWIGAVGTNYTLVIPLLISTLTNGTSVEAVETLGRIARDPGITIPALTNCLETAVDARMRRAAVYAISEFGTNGITAVPSLIRAMDDEDYLAHDSAISALQKISPSTPRKAYILPFP